MCNACWEVIKCPGKVLCCCCECACNMLMGFICSGIVLLVIIFVILWFTVFNKDKDTTDDSKRMAEKLIQNAAPENFRDFFKPLY